mgnify:CR=1 FL=1
MESEPIQKAKDGASKNYTPIKEMAKKARDMVNLDINKPVLARLKKRIREIQEESRAKITKVPMGNSHTWYTEPPKMFISNLQANLSNNVGTISYQVYKKEGENKKLKRMTTKVKTADGKEEEREYHAEYIIEKMVIERIEFRKPITKEELPYEDEKNI